MVQDVSAEPPRVALATPAYGEAEVDPAITEIRVEFDQDMNTGGMSWVGGGELYPQMTGAARWVDARACVMPVRLEADHVYALSINSYQFQNFRSAQGEAAEPYLLMFRTRSTQGAAAPLSEALNRASIAALRQAIDLRYAHRDRLGLDWTTVIDEHEEALLGAPQPFTFAALVARMLAVAEDPHLAVSAQGGNFATYQRDVKPNYYLGPLSQRLNDFQMRSAVVLSGRFDDGTGYICIGTWNRSQEALVAKAFEALAELRDAPALIIDVRPNGGGDELLAREFAGCFIQKPIAYARNIYRDASKPSGFTEPVDRIVEPNPKHPLYRGKVIVLIGPAVMSSCESFVKMMKLVPGCRLVGSKTAGSSGNPKPVVLPNRVTLLVPSWKDLFPDGSELEGVGIAPDVEVDAKPEEFKDGDPVVDRALELIKVGQ